VIVLDASAAVELLLATPDLGRRAAGEIAAAGGALHAPHLLDAEVGQVMRALVRRGTVTDQRASGAIDRLRTLPLTRYPHMPFLKRAFELGENATFYDALYLTLAESLGAPLLTADRALVTVPGHGAEVRLLEPV
jgi:predicted nucleic acid-binding protein